MIGLLEFPANKKPWNRVIATKETRDGQASAAPHHAALRRAPPLREGYKSLLFVHNVNFSAVQEVKESLRQSTSSGKDGFEFFHSRSGSSIVELATGSGFKDAIDLDEALQKDSNPNPEPKWIRESIHCIDNLLYIYTSGTTGLPKAVIIKHVR